MSKSAIGYTPAQWGQIRKHLKDVADQLGSIAALAAEIGVKANTITSFLLGRSKGLSEETMSALREKGLLPDLEIVKDNEPLEGWTGELKSVGQAAEDKGYSPATIRRYCKSGKLNYVKAGRRYHVAVDEKYGALKETEVAQLRKENAKLRTENAKLQRKVTQMEMDFEEPETKTQELKKSKSPSLLDADFFDVAIAYDNNIAKGVRVASKYVIFGGEVAWPMQKMNGKLISCVLRFPISRLEGVIIDRDARLVVFPVSFEGILSGEE